MRRLWFLLVFAACELAGPGPETIELAPPDAPELAAIRTSSTVHDPPPPAAAVRPLEAELDEPRPGRLDLTGVRSPLKRWFLSLHVDERHVIRKVCRIREVDPCAGLIRVKMEGAAREPIDALLASLDDRASRHVARFCESTTGAVCATPLVVSFDGAPIELRPATHRFAFRDEAVATDWPTAATPWIAIDRDGDGAITSGRELFGDATANNGYAALALLDTNHDGVIDRDDRAFAQLLLWADANGDRASSPDELTPLANKITAIPLAHRVERRCVRGNCEGERGIAQLAAGGTAVVVDIYLAER